MKKIIDKKLVRGAGGGGGDSGRQSVEADDTLSSKQFAKVIDVLSEGPIVGLVNGMQSIYMDETPLQNADGTFNFKDVVAIWRSGTQRQEPLEGFSAVEFEQAVGVEVKKATPVVRTLTNPEATHVRVTIAVPSLTFQDPSTGDLLGSSAQFKIEIQNNGGGYVEKVVDTIEGKTVARYQRSHLIELPAGGPWDIRVTRITDDATSVSVQNKTVFDSYTGIINSQLTYPNSALVGLRLDAAQFNSVPTRAYGIKGLIVQVPTNYNVESRTYSGIWDGTFRPSWTDNPAWCFYDLLINDRYGLGDLIDIDTVDKWALYAIARYCDELVPTGFGGMEPRFTCNLYLQTREEAYKVVQNFASIFRAITFWGAGSIVAMQDRPADPIMQYTNANVIDGAFNYSGSSIKQRHTVALVAWNDPKDFYRQKVEYVQDEIGVAQLGVIEAEVAAFGCASRGQAHRMGEWLLMTERLATEVVSFRAGLDSCALYPGAIIKTADINRAGVRMGGRIAGAAGTTITLDADAVLEAGQSYSISVVTESGALESRAVTNVSGTTRGLTIASAFSAAPPSNAVFILSATNLTPQLWRVIGATEADENTVEVSAIEHHPSLYDVVERGLTFEAPQVSNFKNKPAMPTNLTLVTSRYQMEGATVGLKATLSWSGVTGKYNVRWRRAGGMWFTRDVKQASIEIDNVEYDVYEFNVVAVSATGKLSDAAVLTESIIPDPTELPDVTGLASEGPYTTSSAKIKWNAVPGATSYEVQATFGGIVKRAVNVGNALRFDYSAADMRADGGPWRSVVFRVRAIGNFGSISEWAEVTLSNPQVGAINGIEVDAAINIIFLKYAKPVEDDFAGVIVWLGATSEFETSDTNKVYDGPNTFLTINKQGDGAPLVAGDTYYVKLAGYDSFGKDSLTISGSMAVTPTGNAPGENSITKVMIQDGVIDATKLADEVVSTAKFANGIEPVGMVDALPDPAGYTGPKVVMLTTNGKLYRYTGGAWEAKIKTVDLDGTIIDSQIAANAITADKIEANAITAGKVAAGAINAREIAAGAITTKALAIGSFENLIPDPEFNSPSSWYAPFGETWGNGFEPFSTANTPLAAVRRALRITSATNLFDNAGLAVPLELGATYRTRVRVYFSSDFIGFFGGFLHVPQQQWHGFGAPVGGNSYGGLSMYDHATIGLGGAAKVYESTFTNSATVINPADPNTYTQMRLIGDIQVGYVEVAFEAVRVSDATLIKDGAITTAKLSVGTGGKNILYNSGPSGGTVHGWASGYNTTGVAMEVLQGWDNWRPDGAESVCLRPQGNPANDTIADLVSDNVGRRYTVKANQRYEFSVYLSAHRCNTDIAVVWFDESGNQAGESHGTGVNNNSAGGALVNWGRSTLFATAPATAVSCEVFVRSYYLGLVDPYTFAAMFYAGEAAPNQTEFSPWSPSGVTTIHGGMLVTESIAAEQISTNAITSVKINAGAITTDKILANAITSEKIVANAVTADKIAANAVTAGKIFAGSITSEKIAAGSISAAKLSVAARAGNLIYNSGPSPLSVDGYAVGFDNTGNSVWVQQGWAPWAPKGASSVCLVHSGAPANGTISTMYSNNRGANYPVKGGQRYEFSVYLSLHGCNAAVRVIWFDNAGNQTGAEAEGSMITANAAQGALTSFPRSTLFATAPPSAATCQVMVRCYFIGAATPHAFASMWYAGEATMNQADFSPWSAGGVTVIDGGMITTDSITAEKLNVIELSAITANIGLLRTTSIGQRTEIDNNGVRVYDANGTMRVRLGVW